ncbi:hypothetical protein LINGRAHAP2_LOCUS24509, partial [Linum grandiflorum]
QLLLPLNFFFFFFAPSLISPSGRRRCRHRLLLSSLSFAAGGWTQSPLSRSVECGRRRWSPPPPPFSPAAADGGDDESYRLLLFLSGVGCFSEVGGMKASGRTEAKTVVLAAG